MPKPWETAKQEPEKKKPWQTVSNKLSDTPPSAPDDLEKFAAGGLGAVQGATFGLAPKAVGLFSPELGADLKQRIEAAQKNHPMAYYPGEALGSLATAKIPGLSMLNPVGSGFLKGLGQSAAAGGLLGLGESGASDLAGVAKDVAKGAALGGVAHGVTSAVAPIMSAGKAIVKKPLNVLLGASEEAVDRYMTNPQAVMNAPKVQDVTENVLNSVAKFKDDVIQGSKTSRGILDQGGQRFSGQEIAAQYQKKIDDILSRSEGALSQANQSSIKVLENMRDTFAGVDSVSANRLKDELQELGQKTKWEVSPGQFLEMDERFKQDIRSGLDGLLKTASPEYKDQMLKVSADTKLLNQINDRFKNPEQTDRLLNRIRTGKAPYAREELKLLDGRYGTTFDDDLQNALARESFEKGATSPGGSRNVNLYGQVGEDIGRKTNIPFAGTAGRVAGAIVDKAGPKIGKGILDLGLGIKNTYQALPGSSMLSNAVQSTGGVLGQVPWNVPLTDYALQSPWVGMNKGQQK